MFTFMPHIRLDFNVLQNSNRHLKYKCWAAELSLVWVGLGQEIWTHV